MNKTILLGAAFSLVAFSAQAADLVIDTPAVPEPAASQFSGYVEIGATQLDFYSDKWTGFSAAGALAYKLTDEWQIEAEVSLQAIKGTADDYYTQNSGIAALHANYYGGGFALGAFGGVSTMGEYEGDEGQVYSGFVGVEGQVNVTDNLILDGQVGYLKSFDAYYQDDYPMGVTFAQAGVKFFPLDNIKLQATVGIAKGDLWDSDDIDLLTWGLEGEYQFENTPFSLFAAYSNTTDNYYGYDSSQVKVGARFSFDGESLKDQATTGASHKVMDFGPIETIRWY